MSEKRGEDSFVKFPKFAAKLYDKLMGGKSTQIMMEEVAQDLTSQIQKGRVLDIGSGPGHLLYQIHKKNPELKLFGLDISESMIKIAQKNLSGISVEFKKGNIESTDFENDFFDLITSTGSFYLWNNPVNCLNEIHRILKKETSAYIFDSYQDCNQEEFENALQNNLEQESLLYKKLAPKFLKRQLSMAYKVNEIENIIKKTRFVNNFKIDKIILAELPIWLRIQLKKT